LLGSNVKNRLINDIGAQLLKCYVLFLDEKNQKSSHTGCFFAAHGLRCKAGKTKGPVLLPLVVARVNASGKITNALATTQADLFYRLLPEAARLTFLE
jgi:hypothetical protein